MHGTTRANQGNSRFASGRPVDVIDQTPERAGLLIDGGINRVVGAGASGR